MLNFFFKRSAFFLFALTSLFSYRANGSISYIESKIFLDSPEINLYYPIYDPLDPTNFSQGLIDFELPLNINNSIQYDPNSGQYIYNSFLGDSLNFRPSSEVSLQDYLQIQQDQSMKDFWKKNLDEMSDYKYQKYEDEIAIKEPDPKKLFGSDFVEIRPQGSAELSFGINSSRTDNPVLPERQRSITTFDFDQKIQMN